MFYLYHSPFSNTLTSVCFFSSYLNFSYHHHPKAHSILSCFTLHPISPSFSLPYHTPSLSLFSFPYLTTYSSLLFSLPFHPSLFSFPYLFTICFSFSSLLHLITYLSLILPYHLSYPHLTSCLSLAPPYASPTVPEASLTTRGRPVSNVHSLPSLPSIHFYI